MDKNSDQWTILLKGHGLQLPTEVVKQVATHVVAGNPLHPLYSDRKHAPVAGKGTVYKIKKLIEDGKLDPILEHWGLKKSTKADPMQLAHLKALKTFLQTDPVVPQWFSVGTPEHLVGYLFQQLTQHPGLLWVPVLRDRWRDLPISSKIRAHCPEHVVWRHIDDWDLRVKQHLDSKVKTGRQLFGDFRRRLPFAPSVIFKPEGEQHLLTDIFAWLIGQLLGTVPRHGSVGCVLKQKQQAGVTTFCLVWDGLCYAEGPKERIDSARQIIEDMLKQWSASEEIRSLAREYQYLAIMGDQIRKEILEIDEVVLSQGSCPDCSTPSREPP